MCITRYIEHHFTSINNHVQRPFCNLDVRETIEHILLDCKRWDVVRASTISPMIYRLREDTDLANVDITNMLLGGSSAGYAADNWTCSKEEARRPEEASSLGCVKVAEFLQRISATRLVVLRELRSAAKIPEDQGPNGHGNAQTA
jgi:hypothetical protein